MKSPPVKRSAREDSSGTGISCAFEIWFPVESVKTRFINDAVTLPQPIKSNPEHVIFADRLSV